MKKEIIQTATGSAAIDGAGVHLTRVLGPKTMYKFDPFLMLDAFDAKNPELYIKGFPMHPHRGIETFTYLKLGQIDHQDSLGNKGTINSGESQWMTSGSGIMHEEMPQPAEHMLGLQLWINLPADEKMTEPKYFDITNDMVKEITEAGAKIRVLAGEYNGHQGPKGHHLPTTILDVTLEAGKEFKMVVDSKNTLFVYIFKGSAIFGGNKTKAIEKSAVLFGEGDEFSMTAEDQGIHFFLAMAPPLDESIAWGGPVVMNTREELDLAFKELGEGKFIKHRSES